MPALLWQVRFETLILVEPGLKLTQSSPTFAQLFCKAVRTHFGERVLIGKTNLNCDIVAIDGIEAVCIPKITWVGLKVIGSARQIDVVHENILRLNHDKVPMVKELTMDELQ